MISLHRIFLKVVAAFQALSTRNTTRAEAADTIDRFINGKPMGDWEWDDFCCKNVYRDSLIQRVVDECIEVYYSYPADKPRKYCNDQGMDRLRELRDYLIAHKDEETTSTG